MTLARLAGPLADRLDPPARSENPYWDRPADWVADHVRFRAGEGITPYQAETLDNLVAHERESVRGPHGLGKTAIAAWAVLWFSLTRDGLDWKIPTTASAWRQLTHFLWPEIRKWARALRWDRLGRPPFDERHELLQLSLHLATGEAFAVASNNPGLIEGAHADHILYVYDEAKLIPEDTFDASEGAFAGAGPDTGREALALAISTPGEPVGRFHAIHARRPGLEDWHARHVRLDEAIAAGRVSSSWAEARRRQWRETSALFQNRVLGEFATSDADGVIPLPWVELANDRWRDQHPGCVWDRAGGHQGCDLGPFTSVGVDVSRQGRDDTVLALRHEWTIAEVRVETNPERRETTTTSGRVAGVLMAKGGRAVVDVVGVGAGVVDELRNHHGLRRQTVAFSAGSKTDRKDRSGEMGFVDCRSAAWWHLRELLDPELGEPIALPPDDELVGELVAPHWSEKAGSRIKVESKDEIAGRSGRSTDLADGVVQAFWPEEFRPARSARPSGRAPSVPRSRVARRPVRR